MMASASAFTFSSGIRRIHQVEKFLGVASVSPPADMLRPDTQAACALVWGRKQTSRKTLKWADHHGVPVWYLEDGFVRSSSANPHSRVTYSLIVDDKGVYYDASCPNLLEDFLNQPDDAFNRVFDPELQTYSKHCLDFLVDNNISKYNFCPDISADHWLASEEKAKVLVVDQTYDDASVRYGAMTSQRFVDMLDAAIDENPGAHIIVKSHPDVISGRKKGYLTELAIKRGVTVESSPVNPLSLLKLVDRVYCGTSQLGFEALLVNKPVSLFGLPFYAGWGATDDRCRIPRRTATRTREELFFAAYDWYTRYCNPVTGERWSLKQCLEHIQLQKQYFVANRGEYTFDGITPWKRGYLRQFLKTPYKADSAAGTEGNAAPNRTVTWSYRTLPAASSDDAKVNGTKPNGTKPNTANALWRVEDGFLRGAGLGSDYHPPQSLVFDSTGMYFNSRTGCDLEHILNSHDCTPADIQRAQRLITLIISRRLSKYNVGSKNIDPVFAASRKTARKLLVIGQVESDASLEFGCRDISDNSSLLRAVRQANPDADIVFKPHPDVVAGNRKGLVTATVLDECQASECSDVDIVVCIDQCDEVHTMTSLSGFEALMRGKKVFAYGLPFYAGWGLTSDRHTEERRVRRRTLEELVYCVLIVYPRYVDFVTGEFISPEDLVVSLSGQSGMQNKNMKWANRQVLKIKNVYKGLAYAP